MMKTVVSTITHAKSVWLLLFIQRYNFIEFLKKTRLKIDKQKEKGKERKKDKKKARKKK